ncbi:MAG TPA: GMC family oxidoreductase [Ktedonobacterales bacterium]|nr:GMC family oxidoreductase [Ktedonobacterales bacterium]
MATEHGAAQTTTATASTGAPANGWLSVAQLRTLEAICDALIPAVAPPAGEDDAHGFYARTARDVNVAALMVETLGQESPQQRAQFAQLLDLLGSPTGGLLLAGRATGLAGLPLPARAAALQRMSVSSVAMLRQGFSALKRLATFIFYAAPGADGLNPNWPALGYTPAPPPPSPEAAPKRIGLLPLDADLNLTADAVIVGSGAGGGVVAAQLVATGKDVVVLEKGGYYNEADFNGSEALMTPQLYLRRGTLATKDLGMIVLAGSCLGGGTIVNWSTSLRTPPDVLAEWEREHGLTGVAAPEYQQGFEAAERRLGINTEDSEPNANNAALQRGCEALGYEWRRIPRNASDCQQRCGACGYGCPHGRKQSTMITFLQDAADGGARFVVRCQVERVVIERGRATGVEGWALDESTGQRRRVRVTAQIVVVAGGSVESPALLLRSGLRNPNIGAHLRLHPVVAMAAYYEEPVEPWKGSLQTVLSDHFKHMQGGYGLRFEVAPAHPGMLGMVTPWRGGAQHKQDMARSRHAATFIALMRDTGEGRVTLDKQGDPILNYFPNATDRRALAVSMGELAKIAAAGGATRVAALHSRELTLDAEGARPGAISAAKLRAFASEAQRRGIAPNTLPVFSAHQMGSCRLGASERTAVADPWGEVFGAKGLFIGDASGFPTASGVNPMLSIMALAHRVSQRIIAGVA